MLDASAILCLLNEEPGAQTVLHALPGAIVSAVNLSEVAAKLSDHGMAPAEAGELLSSLSLRTEPFDETLAMVAADIRARTRPSGLSLGDRACLATARQLGAVAVTADRAWAMVARAIEVEIEVVR